jgi:hypothetical protein
VPKSEKIILIIAIGAIGTMVIAMVIAVAVGAGLLLGKSESSGLFGSPPSDAQMIRNFQNHRTQYEQLLQMIQTDSGLERVGTLAGNSPENPATVGVDEARLQQYATTLKQLHVQSLERGGDSHQFLFTTHSYGLVTSGTAKGYYYSEQAPSPLVQDTDKASGEEGKFYRRIEGNWYVWYEAW